MAPWLVLVLVVPGAQAGAPTCWLVADAGKATQDLLTRFDPDDPDAATNETAVGAGTGTEHIEAIALQPGTGALFAVDGGQLGTLHPVTGAFTAHPKPLGTALGSGGQRALSSVVGIAFDPDSGALYGVARVTGPDVLVRIDPETGSHVPSAFGAGQSYLAIVVKSGATSFDDLDDLAIDPSDGTTYAIAHAGPDYRLVALSRKTGANAILGALGVVEMEGLTFRGPGQLLATAGGGGRAVYRVSLKTGAATDPVPIDDGSDYEAIACTLDGSPVVAPEAADEDGDGLSDDYEASIGSSPSDPDTDGDSVGDNAEVGPLPASPRDTDGDLIPDVLDTDDDGDGIPTLDEVVQTASVGADQDEDGLAAWLDLDSDGDTILDSDERDRDSDGDGVGDPYDEDSDGDGIPDADEAGDTSIETPPVDTDGDGLADARDIDSDADGVLDSDDACRTKPGPANRFGCAENQSTTEGGVTVGPLSVHGGACATTEEGGSAVWLLIGTLVVLIGIRRRGRRSRPRSLPLYALALGFGADAGAQGLAVQQLAPSLGGDGGYVAVQGATTLAQLDVALGVFQHYTWRSLVASGPVGDITLLEHQLQVDVAVALGLGADVELGVAVPVSLFQSAGSGASPVTTSALGDARLVARWHVVGDTLGPAMALAVAATFPTGQSGDLLGNDGMTVEPRLVFEWRGALFRLAINAGYIIRKNIEFHDLRVGSELTGGLAVAVDVAEHVALVGEVFGRAPLDGDVEARLAASPVEGLLAARVRLAGGHHTLMLGTGTGFTEGYGAPRVRVFLGYTFTTGDAQDYDHDGIPDVVDRCPNAAEDPDGVLDDDGCPEADGDGDGIGDSADKCPLEAEDRDDFEDDDGCPDGDNDGDGIPDAADACPDEAEDRDGTQDDDGCPDPDNDGDGIPDTADKCPNQPETPNGNEDADGCPDEASLARIGKATVETTSPIEFAKKTKLTTSTLEVIDAVAALLVARQDVTLVRVEAWGDGHRRRSLALARTRATLVRDLLVDRGIDPERLVIEAHPTAGHRVVLTVAEIDGLPPTDPGWFRSPGQ